jgi:hypothetical protein
MAILTEPIGSIPRPASLIRAVAAFQADQLSDAALEEEYANALQDTIKRLEQTGSPLITDGEPTKPSFATYALAGLKNLAPDGVVIPFADGHIRQLPRLTESPFRYGVYAAHYLEAARAYSQRPIKPAVISASAMSLPEGEREAAVEEALNSFRSCKSSALVFYTPRHSPHFAFRVDTMVGRQKLPDAEWAFNLQHLKQLLKARNIAAHTHRKPGAAPSLDLPAIRQGSDSVKRNWLPL